MYRERRDAMLDALDDLMPAAGPWNVPGGGFYVWLTLPEGLDAKAMLPRAVTARVAYVPGPRSTPTGSALGACGCASATRRPSASGRAYAASPAVIEAELELRETFGATSPR